MSGILFACDLDNTLLYSLKHLPEDIKKVCVEYYQEKPQGFFSERTVELLREVCRKVSFIPVTTRSMEQYRRILWPEGCEPEIALMANGAILLEHGRPDEAWQQASRETVRLCAAELGRLYALLSRQDIYRHCRLVDQMYLFVSCEDEETASVEAARCRELTELDVQVSGRKIYFFPPGIDKGTALDRLRKRFPVREVLCAGDSRIDLPMLRRADTAFVPSGELFRELPEGKGCLCGQKALFAEEFLAKIRN